MLKEIHNYLQERAQKFCDRFTELTGLTKFWLEKWSVIAATAAYLMFWVQMSFNVAIGALCVILLAMSTLLVFGIEMAERERVPR